jgi:hypothetical protein
LAKRVNACTSRGAKRKSARPDALRVAVHAEHAQVRMAHSLGGAALLRREDGVDADERDARAGRHDASEHAVDGGEHVARHLAGRNGLGRLLELEHLLVDVLALVGQNDE